MAYTARTWTNGSGLAMSAANLNVIENGIASCSQDIEALSERIIELMSSKTVWENPNPTENFAAQEFEVDLSEYKRFSILFKEEKSYSRYIEYQVSQKNVKMYFGVNHMYSYDYIYGRTITFTDDKIMFSDTLKNQSTNSSYNNLSIPVKIIGYRY